MRIAKPLQIAFGLVRFMSLINGKIFSFLKDGERYELVELENNDPTPFIKRVVYQGNNADEVKEVIVKEVCDV